MTINQKKICEALVREDLLFDWLCEETHLSSKEIEKALRKLKVTGFVDTEEGFWFLTTLGQEKFKFEEIEPDKKIMS